MTEARLITHKCPAGAELVPVRAAGRWVDDPLPGRRLHQLAQHVGKVYDPILLRATCERIYACSQQQQVATGGAMRKLALATAFMLAVGVGMPTATAAGGQFTYILQANGPISSASFFDGINEMRTITDLPASWSQTFANQATYQMHSISAQTDGTQISCQVIVNGSVADQQATTGRYTVVTCSA
jgi:hypothetical protein